MTISFSSSFSDNFFKKHNSFAGPKPYWPAIYPVDSTPISTLSRNNQTRLKVLVSRENCEIFVRDATRRGIWLANRGKEPQSAKKYIKKLQKENPNFPAGNKLKQTQQVHQDFYVKLQHFLDCSEGPFLWRNRFDSIDEEMDYLNNHWKVVKDYWEQKKAEKK